MLKSNTDVDHVVPISKQVLRELKELHAITGKSQWLFPSALKRADQPMSDGAFAKALHRLGYKDIHCLHGFRSSFNTITRKIGKFDSELVKVQMHHSTGKVDQAYNRGRYLKRRRKMMQWWSNKIDKMAAKAAKSK